MTASQGARVEATVTHLLDEVARLEAPLEDGRAVLTWQPPAEAPRGYGLALRALDASGAEIATASAAFDVLESWLQAPRYGFLSEFAPGRDDIDATMAWAARYHLTGLQFYDWQYRHEQLLPPDDPYTDLLGRRLSLDTVTRLIDTAHARNIAAMPYTAIYGASPAFYEAHPDWGLFQADDVVFDFADGLLKIMDPTPDRPGPITCWTSSRRCWTGPLSTASISTSTARRRPAATGRASRSIWPRSSRRSSTRPPRWSKRSATAAR